MVDQPAPLRIGIIIDSFVQPRWVRRSLEKVLASGVASIEFVVNTEKQQDKSSLLHKLYNRVDRKLFESDALELTSIEDLLEPSKPSAQINSELDVMINFAGSELNAKYAGAAKHGVWFYSFGEAPGFNEVKDQIPISSSLLKGLKENKEYVVYKSVTPTLSRFSVRLNNNTCYWKSAAFVARGLEDLHAKREFEKMSDGGQMPGKAPGNAAMTEMFLKLSGRAAARVFEKFSSFEQWVLAYQIKQGEFKYLIPPPNRFWADPFPLKVDGKYYIFFEEFVNELGRAHISVVEVDENGIVAGPTEVLKLDCHLSYPFVFEWQNDYYMIPETGQRNVVELYRAVSFPFEWRPEKVLLETNRPLDATVVEVDKTWWMFVNVEEEGVAVNWDELHLYYSDSLFGPWKPHARNPIVSDVRSARPAGRLFWSNDILYRPGQDSSLRYGYATTINKVTNLTAVAYEEVEVVKILPDWDDNITGVHTLNFVDDLTVIDCLAKRRRMGNVRFGSPKRSLDRLSSVNIEPRGEANSNSVSRIDI
ncbi:MAG TPA: hypothetical protein VFY61_16455 [Pyrinomonadaceae bacterium]|nr:hypothetical protein [Pyrinomonadaceae bacterium]